MSKVTCQFFDDEDEEDDADGDEEMDEDELEAERKAEEARQEEINEGKYLIHSSERRQYDFLGKTKKRIRFESP